MKVLGPIRGRIVLIIVAFDLVLLELLPFAKLSFPDFSLPPFVILI